MLSKALEMGVFPLRPQFWGTLRVAPFLLPLREEKNIYLGEFYKKFERYVEKLL
jgi:hypothetical protein